MKLLSKFNKGFRFLLCVINIYRKYAWVVNLKDKKGTTITSAFQKILKESTCDLKGEEIAGRFYKKELQKTKQKEFSVEKAIKEKGDKLYVKWKG